MNKMTEHIHCYAIADFLKPRLSPAKIPPFNFKPHILLTTTFYRYFSFTTQFPTFSKQLLFYFYIYIQQINSFPTTASFLVKSNKTNSSILPFKCKNKSKSVSQIKFYKDKQNMNFISSIRIKKRKGEIN